MIFHEGDRVRSTSSTAFLPEGTTGTVKEDSDCPWVDWDNGMYLCRNGDFLKLVEG